MELPLVVGREYWFWWRKLEDDDEVARPVEPRMGEFNYDEVLTAEGLQRLYGMYVMTGRMRHKAVNIPRYVAESRSLPNVIEWVSDNQVTAWLAYARAVAIEAERLAGEVRECGSALVFASDVVRELLEKDNEQRRARRVRRGCGCGCACRGNAGGAAGTGSGTA